jgi:outer membrane translocation and assembly module TamA
VLRVAPAAFVDGARAFRAAPFSDTRGHVDVGLGLRVALPGAGVFRADIARGLRDGNLALSFGYGIPNP